jgi:hypothetical protein
MSINQEYNLVVLCTMLYLGMFLVRSEIER